MKCGKSGEEHILDTHHTTYHKSLKYNSTIGLLLCKKCHKLGHCSPHKGGVEFYNWFIHSYPNLNAEIMKLIEGIDAPVTP